MKHGLFNGQGKYTRPQLEYDLFGSRTNSHHIQVHAVLKLINNSNLFTLF